MPTAVQNRAVLVGLIVGSDEAHTRVINTAYQAYLGRPADPQGLANWLTAMRQGATYEQLEATLLNSVEYRTRPA
jgi:hypothetical protein